MKRSRMIQSMLKSSIIDRQIYRVAVAAGFSVTF
jgi:hypothetical protein